MYPLDEGMWGPTVRISHLRDELARLTSLDVIDGYRGARRLTLARYAASGRLRRLDGIYVESSSFLPAELDIAFLGLARALGIPVLTYIRDAYQLFSDYGKAASLRQRMSAAAFRPMVSALGAVSTWLAFPSLGLAGAVLRDASTAVLLPPGSPAPISVPRLPHADRLLFVGDARLPAHGADRLIESVKRVRSSGTPIELEVVCRLGQEPPAPHPPWLHVVRAEGPALAERLPRIIACVIPRPRGPYNDLAVPVKLYDYLSYGRPLLVTDCIEQARVVRESGAGVVVGDSVDALADGIVRVAGASAQETEEWGNRAQSAARAASWERRAHRIVEILQQGT